MITAAMLIASAGAFSQASLRPEIPAVLDGLTYNDEGRLVLSKGGKILSRSKKETPTLSLK